MRIGTRNLLAGVALAALAMPALADESGWYAGIGLGSSTAKGACDGVSGPGVSCDESDTALKLYGGYQMNRHFAVEFGYADLGKARASFAGFGDVSVGATGVEVLGVGILPINPAWSIYGKLGVFSWHVDANDGTGLVGSTSANGASLTYAGGIAYQATPHVALRAEYQQYSDVGDENTTGQGDIGVFALGLTYKF